MPWPLLEHWILQPIIRQWCKFCLHIWCGFPLPAPTLQHGLTNAALSLGEQWHPEIFACLRRPEDCSWVRNLRPSSVCPEIQTCCCFEAPILTRPAANNKPCGGWCVSFLLDDFCELPRWEYSDSSLLLDPLLYKILKWQMKLSETGTV